MIQSISHSSLSAPHFRARNYSAELGRFIRRDPLVYANGSSLYAAYFMSNTRDISGECRDNQCIKEGEKVILKLIVSSLHPPLHRTHQTPNHAQAIQAGAQSVLQQAKSE